MRPAHSFTICALSLAWGMSALPSFAAESSSSSVSASTAAKAAPAVFNPAAPTAPLQHQPLAASGAIVTQPSDWKAANAAVAEFPRGHADVLKWEKSQSALPGQAAPVPSHQHHQHGGQP